MSHDSLDATSRSSQLLLTCVFKNVNEVTPAFPDLPGEAQHQAVLPGLRLAQVRLRRRNVGVHSDRH